MSTAGPNLDDLRIERKPTAGRNAGAGWVLLLLVLLVMGAAAAWWWTRSRAVEIRSVPAREAATTGQDRTVLNASGYVTARRSATVSSKITGKVIEVMIEEGMKVKEGEVLARLDDTNVKASLHLAEAQLTSALAALAETQVRIREADQELARQADLLKTRIATRADYDHAEAASLALKARLEQQQADIAVAERTVATWQQQLEDTVIRAPFSGIVTSKNAQPGEMISPVSAGGGFTRTGICTIVDMQSLEIEIDVNESYINRIESSQPVEATLDAYPEWRIPCRVIAIVPTADRQKSTVKVRVGFDRLDPRILPEMSIKVAFREGGAAATTVKGRAVMVPKAAIRQQDNRDIVLVVQKGRLERRAITVSRAVGDEATLSAGLAPGERVVVEGPAGLTDGTVVREVTAANP